MDKLRIFDTDLNKLFEVSFYDYENNYLITSKRSLYTVNNKTKNNLIFMKGILFDSKHVLYENDIVSVNYIYYDFNGYDDCRLMSVSLYGIVKYNCDNELIIKNIEYTDGSINNFNSFNLNYLLSDEVFEYNISVLSNTFDTNLLELKKISEFLCDYECEYGLKLYIYNKYNNTFIYKGFLSDFSVNLDSTVEELYYNESLKILVLKIDLKAI